MAGENSFDLRSLSPTFLIRVYDRLRDSFWFLPTLAIVLSIAAAAFVVRLDSGVDLGEIGVLGWVSTTPSAARTLLSTVVGALITVTGVVLSMMLLVLSQTATALGPRVVRTVVSGSELQWTLAAFLSTTAFCLTTLRSAREGTGEQNEGLFVPEIGVLVSTLLFFGAVATLIYFVNHVSQIIRVPDLLERLAGDLRESIDRNLPDGPVPPPPSAVPNERRAVESVVTADREGYLQGVDAEELAEVAKGLDGTAVVLVRVGQFVCRRDALVRVEADRGLADDARDRLREAFAVGQYRTPREDVEAIVLEIAEIGVRALSPGVNDPRTARMCLDRLSAGLAVIASRPPESAEVRGEDGRLRVVRPTIDFASLLRSAFGEITFYAGANPEVIGSVVDGVRRVRAACHSDAAAAAVRQEARLLRDELRQHAGVRDRSEQPRLAGLLAGLERLGEAAD